jgi:MFS superfamily sulfate permease-like transporter
MAAATVAPLVTDADSVVELTSLGDAHGLTTLIGLATVVPVFGLRRLVPRIPAPLVAVVLGIVASNVASGLFQGFPVQRQPIA